MPALIDLVGQSFGRLTVLAKSGRKGKARLWLCRCECGSEKEFFGDAIRKGHTKSCGCLKADTTSKRNTKHGFCTGGYQNLSPEYRAWSEAKRRCYTKTYWRYASYGGRGISMCERWRQDFAAFLSDMGPKPEPHRKYTLDRIDNNLGYEPGNCRWVTWSVQSKNRRRVHRNHPKLPEL